MAAGTFGLSSFVCDHAMTYGPTEHPGEQFLRGVNKRHDPPFTIDRGLRLVARPRLHLRCSRGLIVRSFTRWSYAYLALAAMYARHGLKAPTANAVKYRMMREAVHRAPK